jgi:tetratricopeptide (TPR) repeat protein
MMKFPVTLVLLSILLAGCVALQPKLEELDQEIAQYEEQYEYEKALKLIAYVPPKDPEYPRYATKRKEIEGKVEEYSQQTITGAEKLIKEGRWAQALDLYDEAIGRLPNHGGLRDSLAQVHQQQVAAAKAERSKIIIVHGHWLEKSLPVTRKIATILPRDKKAKNKLRQQEKETQLVAEQLAKLGDEAMRKEDYVLAEQTLSLAARLSDSEPIQQSWEKLKKYKAAEKKKGRLAVEQKKSRKKQLEQKRKAEIKRLTAAYNKAFDSERHLNARQHLKSLAELKPAELPIDSMVIRLEKAILDKAEKHYQEGVSLYSQSQFEAALRKWEEALRLNPKHLLAKENAERARKVVKRLQELRKK